MSQNIFTLHHLERASFAHRFNVCLLLESQIFSFLVEQHYLSIQCDLHSLKYNHLQSMSHSFNNCIRDVYELISQDKILLNCIQLICLDPQNPQNNDISKNDEN
ncbi:hypothetical protein FGO68_gene4795 [Halteria grandinella]|uniref:Uncharacterized protein n=1 Tax=Halteria grandinella TaxID=5974 RepID=A0A8J8P4J3_HALGN|nr:hypothetical protein FGO68_gene4795 [Halteria grandinella]